MNMTHLPHLIQDLGIILMTAAVVTLLFKKLKQPVVLGYLLAGFLLSPKFPLFVSVKDTANISIWAEIGVIFMLFGLGLEFSFKKLTQVGRSASITASFEILFMLGIGFVCGKALGWSSMDSLFLGGILSISSTTIIVRAFEELGLKGRNFVSLVFGVLIVEDLIAILLLVLLSSVAATQSLSGSELLYTSLRLGFFMVLWFLLGIYLLPVLLKRFRDFLSDETTLIVSLGLCLMMVIVATSVGFSPALGAFVMGSILAETREGQRIEHLILPVKDLFSAIFFVSVGMLIDLNIIIEYFGVILFVSLVTIVGKVISTSIGALVSGRSLKISVQTGMSLAQIGEFSFIIATLGMTLKVTSEFLYPIAVAVSALTTFSTPYLIKYTGPFYTWLEGKLPQSFKESLARYEATMISSSDESILSLVWREYGVKIALNAVVVIAMSLAMSRLALPKIALVLGENIPAELITCLMTLAMAGPFLWAVFFGGPAHKMTYKGGTAKQLRNLQIGVAITRFFVGCLLAGFLVSNFTSILAVSGLSLIALAALSAFFFSKYSEPAYQKIEKRFLSNLTAKEREELEQKAKTPELAPWDAALATFEVSPQSKFIAKTLEETRIKEGFGVTVAMIERGSERILAPKRHDLLLPGDRVFLIGTDEQLAVIRPVMEVPMDKGSVAVAENFGLTSMVLSSSNRFVNKTIRDCGLREAADGLIVGIERSGERMLSPHSSTVLLAEDLVWIVGDISKIKALSMVSSQEA